VTGTSASSLANLLYIAESQIQDQGLYIVSGLLEYLQYGTQRSRWWHRQKLGWSQGIWKLQLISQLQIPTVRPTA